MRARAWLTLGLCLLAHGARADAALLSATLRCERAPGPGRVICEVSASTSRGKLVWSDALIVRVPAFARPMRSRFSARLGPSNRTASAKFAVLALQAGAGTVELLARGVVCRVGPGAESCLPSQVSVTTWLEVGEAPSAPPPSP